LFFLLSTYFLQHLHFVLELSSVSFWTWKMHSEVDIRIWNVKQPASICVHLGFRKESISSLFLGQDFCLGRCYFILFVKVLFSLEWGSISFVLGGLIQASDSEIKAQEHMSPKNITIRTPLLRVNDN
jgi:hypothetical protein